MLSSYVSGRLLRQAHTSACTRQAHTLTAWKQYQLHNTHTHTKLARCTTVRHSSSADASDEKANVDISTVSPRRLSVGVIIERYPILTPDPDPFELEFNDYKERIAEGRSKYSMAELDRIKTNEKLRKEKEKMRSSLRARGIDPGEDDGSDYIAGGVKPFQFDGALRKTEADRTMDYKSTQRKLEQTLYLIVRDPSKRKDGFDWRFPQGVYDPADKTLRKAAERVAVETCFNDLPVNGPENKLYFIGNIPSGHMEYVYPDEYTAADKTKACDTFFFRAQWLLHPVQLAKKYRDYMWVTKKELPLRVNKEYYKVVGPMLRDA